MRKYVEGKPIENPPTSIRLFSLMEGMKWAHLPVAGGLYDQHPEFLAEISHIFSERNKYQEKKRKEDERKQKSNSGRMPGVAGRRR